MKSSGPDEEKMQGHWLLASLGKKVLRPGGRKTTRWMLDHAHIAGADVVEIAPGLGVTAAEILKEKPASYVGIDEEAAATAQATQVVQGRGRIITGRAQETGLDACSADVIIGEAMLTMQSDKTKSAIVAEARRILKPGGRYCIHELGLAPDNIDDTIKTDIRKALARSIRVNARPLTVQEWKHLFTSAGFTVQEVYTAPMGLLSPRQMLADEGVTGVAKIIGNMIRKPAARARVLAMRKVFTTHKKSLIAVSLITEKNAHD